MQTTIPLSQLRFGHDAVPPINARTFGRETDVSSLTASIAHHGMIQALTVRKIGDGHFVADGNRRLLALMRLVEKGELTADAPIKVDVDEGNAIAGDELSLAANIERVPMHEADQYQKFWELHERGQSSGQIGERFGIEPKRVDRKLAIGRVAPVILQAWRDGLFDRAAFSCVAAFTLAPSIKVQEQVFKKLQKDRHLNDYSIKRAVGAGDGNATMWVRFIGIEAYKSAGGKIIEDLFGDDHVIGDPKMAEKLGRAKLAKMPAELIASGWSWAAMETDLGQTYSWTTLRPEGKPKATAEQKARVAELEKVEIECEDLDETTPDQDLLLGELEHLREAIELTRWTDEQKKHSGVKIRISARGLDLTFGLVKPGTKKPKPKVKAKKGSASAAEEKKAPVLSNTQARDLSVQLTAAAVDAMKQNPRIGLVTLLAGLSSNQFDRPIKITASGMESHDHIVETFDGVFQRMLTMSDEDLFRIAGNVAAKTIDMQTARADMLPLGRRGWVDFLDALEPTTIQTALIERFDVKGYMTQASKAFILPAIAATIGADEARKAGKMKRDELVAFAIKNVAGKGWLPPEMRTGSYGGPSEPVALAAPVDDASVQRAKPVAAAPAAKKPKATKAKQPA